MKDARPAPAVTTTAARILPLAALALLLSVPLAQAHAVLQTAVPPPNGHAEAGITHVEFHFTEEVERDYTDADVIDPDLESVKAGAWEYGDKKSVIRLPVQPLGDGVYSANWQALSVDSHTTRGSFIFSVGEAQLQFIIPTEGHDHQEHSRGDILRDGFARAVYYGGLFLVIGVPLFLVVVDRGAGLPRHPLGTAALFGGLGAAGALLGLLFLSERTDLTLGQTAGTLAGSSFVWRAGLLGAAVAALVVSMAMPADKRRLPALAAVALGAGALWATSQGSHAAADAQMRTLSILLDALHLAMAAVWIGGVVAFLHVVWGRDAREVGALVHRFSPLAVASVVLLMATGVYASLRHIPRVESLWADDYGRLVSAKVALLGVLVLFGAYNQRVLGPKLRSGATRPAFFRRVLQAEAVVMVLVLGAAGILASTPPPDRGVIEGTQGPPPYLVFENVTASSHVILLIAPNPVTVGAQQITVQVHPGPRGEPVDPNATEVYLKVAAPGEGEPDVTLDPGPQRVTRDTWVLEGGVFTSPGTWSVYLLLQRTDVGEFTKLRFEVPVVLPGQAAGEGEDGASPTTS